MSPQHVYPVTPRSAPYPGYTYNAEKQSIILRTGGMYINVLHRHISIVESKHPGCYRLWQPLVNEKLMKGRIITMLIALSMLGVILGLQFVHV